MAAKPSIIAPPFFLSLTTLFTVFVLTSSSSEPDILLTFKSSIKDPNNFLSTWSNTSSTHYCNWIGITCTSAAGGGGSPSITSLNLHSSNLSGEISSSICQLPNLAHLNLADNLFNKPIPLHLSQCTSLEILNLSNNLIWGTIPDQISQFGYLKVLDFSMNHVEGKIPEAIGELKKLQVLKLGSNLLSGNLPINLFKNLTELNVLDLSQNVYLVSEIPSNIGNLDKLERLFLQGCGFHGEIPESFLGLKSLRMLDLSLNDLSGIFPKKAIDSSLKNLISFDVSQNKLFGSFPDGICNGRKGLINLSLHTNFFNGSIPISSIKDCLNLERFQVQNNKFYGDFPSGLWSLPKIKLIRAENNRFSGQIPDSISMAVQLEQVQIDNNTFSGKLPFGLGSIHTLYRFSASLNNLFGELPPNFCDSPLMSIINLSHNSLSGQIPEPKKCKKLVSLALASNNLTGQIPLSLSDLPVLTYLDLSDNNLTGPIPQELQNLKLALFNVSFNQLSGRVPYSLISDLPASFLQGNPNLCGQGLGNSCSNDLPKNHHHDANLTILICAIISVALVLAIMILAGGFIIYQRSHKRKFEDGNWNSLFFYPLRITENDLIMGMDEKSRQGEKVGVFGGVYALNLPSGEIVAVKKLVNFGKKCSKSLKSEIKTLAKTRHQNIVKILGLCHSEDSIFLIYEFLPKGSLGDLICGDDFCLDWCVRLRIAIGVAQGLAYLHKDQSVSPSILHRNVKSTNILLDEDLVPKIADFGLDRIIGDSAFQSTLASESSLSCYNPPELGYSKRATEQMDVYSFGVVLLELVTGRQAERGDPQEEGSVDILQWVRRKVNITNGTLQVVDSKVPKCYQKEMLEVLDIALRCTSVVPQKRPSMSEVVKALQSFGSLDDHRVDIRV